MAYREDRRYMPRDRYDRPPSYADPYNEPRGRYARYDRDVYARRGSDDSVEEVQRDYPPGEDLVYERGYTSRRPRRPVYENVRRASSVSGYDPHYETGYYTSRPRRSRHYDDRRPRRSRYSPPSSPSPSPPRHRRRKSFSEQALGALGLGAAASGHGDRGRGRSHSRHRPRSRSSSSSRSRSRDRDRGRGRGHSRSRRDRSEQRIAQAARAALTAGAVEAFRQRKEPGEWTGQKGKRILTAAITAGGTDGLVDKDPRKHGTRHVVESTLAGLAANRFMNGSRSQSRGRNGRGRSSGALGGLAASGALAAAGKEIYDRVSRSRSQHRGRKDASDSDDDHRGSKKRSKSVSDYINKGMAALGLDEGGDRHRGDSRDRGHSDRHRERRHHRRPRNDEYSDSDADSDYHHRDSRRDRGSRDVGRHRFQDGKNPPPYAPTSASRGGDGATSMDRGQASSSESDSDLGDSSDEKKKRKKMKRDMLLTTGLASVATIHAAHGVYGSVEKRKERMQQLKEGEITPEEARKKRLKANTHDAVSIGLAALGIKGAYREWKEVNEKRKETNNFQSECAMRAAKRQMRRARSHSAAPSSHHRWPDEIEYAPSASDSLHDHAPGSGNSYGPEPLHISY